MSKISKSKISVSFLAGTAMLSALAAVLQYIEIGLPIMPSFIKFDFSDLPALIGAFAYGPLYGIAIELIKNILHCTVSQTAAIGELSNFIFGGVFVGIAGLFYKFGKTKKRALVGGLLGATAMAIISFPVNMIITYPFYYNFMEETVVLKMYQLILPGMESIPECLLVFNVPFTLVKGLISVIISMLIYKKISPVLKGKS